MADAGGVEIPERVNGMTLSGARVDSVGWRVSIRLQKHVEEGTVNFTLDNWDKSQKCFFFGLLNMLIV